MVKQYREKDPFKMHALLLGDMHTGYARCTNTKCQERLDTVVFQVQEKNRSGLLKKMLVRHLTNYHISDEQLGEKLKRTRERQQRARNQRATSSQQSMDNFVQVAPTRTMNIQVVNQLKVLNAATIAGCNVSFDFFVSEEMLERDRFLLESFGIDPDQVHRFNRGRTAVKEDLFKEGSANQQLIRSVAQALAKTSRLTIMIDHQKVLQLTNEQNSDALGVALVLSATDKKRYTYLLGFQTVSLTSNEPTVRATKLIAQE